MGLMATQLQTNEAVQHLQSFAANDPMDVGDSTKPGKKAKPRKGLKDRLRLQKRSAPRLESAECFEPWEVVVSSAGSRRPDSADAHGGLTVTSERIEAAQANHGAIVQYILAEESDASVHCSVAEAKASFANSQELPESTVNKDGQRGVAAVEATSKGKRSDFAGAESATANLNVESLKSLCEDGCKRTTLVGSGVANAENKTMQEQLTQAQADLNSERETRASLEDAIDSLRKQLGNQVAEAESAHKSQAALREALAEEKQKLNTLQRLESSLRSELVSAKSDSEQWKSTADMLLVGATSLQDTLAEVVKEKDDLAEVQAKLETLQSCHGRAMTALQEKHQRRLVKPLDLIDAISPTADGLDVLAKVLSVAKVREMTENEFYHYSYQCSKFEDNEEENEDEDGDEESEDTDKEKETHGEDTYKDEEMQGADKSKPKIQEIAVGDATAKVTLWLVDHAVTFDESVVGTMMQVCNAFVFMAPVGTGAHCIRVCLGPHGNFHSHTSTSALKVGETDKSIQEFEMT